MRATSILCIVALVACTDDPSTIRALENAGYTGITTTGYEPFRCADGDTYSTGFRATNPAGGRVSGVVCCGVFKGCTIRY
jgi:hypothetical protein